MGKSKDTLVEDIYSLMFSKKADDSVDVEAEIEKFGEAMKDIMKKEFLPKTRKWDGRKLRLSSVGKNDLIQWFSYNGYRGERIKPHTLIKFMYGHMIEEMLLFLVRLTGHEVTDEQKEVSVGGIKGHMDCKIDGTVFDVKSTTKFGLMKFNDGTIAKNDTCEYVEQIKAQTEVYYLNLHQNAINFNAADKSVEIQIDYVAATGTNIIERQTDLLFDAYLYEKELQVNDAIGAIQKEVDNEEAVSILRDPCGANVIQRVDSEFERGTGSNRILRTRPEGTIRIVNTPEEKQEALADLDKLKKRLQVLQANKLIKGLYASSLYDLGAFKRKVNNSISRGIEKFTRTNLLFVPAEDVTGKITGKITPRTNHQNLGV